MKRGVIRSAHRISGTLALTEIERLRAVKEFAESTLKRQRVAGRIAALTKEIAAQ